MKKKIFASIVLAGMMAVGVPTMASAEASVLIIEQESQRITVSVSGSVLTARSFISIMSRACA